MVSRSDGWEGVQCHLALKPDPTIGCCSGSSTFKGGREQQGVAGVLLDLTIVVVAVGLHQGHHGVLRGRGGSGGRDGGRGRGGGNLLLSPDPAVALGGLLQQQVKRSFLHERVLDVVIALTVPNNSQ